MSSRLETTKTIGDHVAVDDLRKLPFEAPHGFGRGLVFGELAGVVIACRSRVHDLDSEGV
jgi:hypothetical protein